MKTLSEIVHKFSSKEKNEDIKRFLGSVIADRGIWKSRHKFFYNDFDKTSEDAFRVIDESYFKAFKPKEWKAIRFAPTGGLIKEFFDNQPFTLELPVFTGGSNVTEQVIEDFLAPMTKEGIIDDLQYTIIRNVVATMGVFYEKESRSIGFGVRQIKNRIMSGKHMIDMRAKEITLEEVLRAEIEQGFVNKEIGDPDNDYAYGHLLRAHANYNLFTWTKNVIINWTKYNILATSRSQGKTFFAAMHASRCLFSSKPGHGGRKYREIKMFVPDKSNIGEQVMEYLESILGDLTQKKYNGKPVIELSSSKQTAKCNVTGNVFKIVSLYNLERGENELGTSVGEGMACDDAIVDEAARIPNSFWTSFHQRAAFETQSFLIITTINRETPKNHWFYELLIDGEQNNPEIKSYRITIDENEAMRWGKTEEEFQRQLELAKETMRKQGDKEFYSKGYCIILEESNVFNTSTYLVPSNPSKYSPKDPKILGFDLAKLSDTCGLVSINLRHREIEMSRTVLNSSYGTQLIHAEEYKKKNENTLVIGDRSGVGEAVSEQDVKGVVDTWIKSTGQGTLRFDRANKYWTCPKSTIIDIMATAFDKNLLKIPADHTDLIAQMNDFVKMKSGKGDIILYKGKGKKTDDLVLATAYAVLYMYSILGLKSVKDVEDYVAEIGNGEIVTYAENDWSSNDQGNYYHNGLY